MESQGKHLLESTQHIFWAAGIPPNYTSITKQDYYHEKNQLGYVRESVRDDLLKETVMKALIDTDSHADFPFPSESTLGDTDLPSPPLQACVVLIT